MKSDTNTAANVGPGVQTEDFAQWVRANQAKLTPELRPHYDFMVFDGPVGSRSQGAVPRLTHAGPAEEIVLNELNPQVNALLESSKRMQHSTQLQPFPRRRRLLHYDS
jgi:hypothetical protein